MLPYPNFFAVMRKLPIFAVSPAIYRAREPAASRRAPAPVSFRRHGPRCGPLP